MCTRQLQFTPPSRDDIDDNDCVDNRNIQIEVKDKNNHQVKLSTFPNIISANQRDSPYQIWMSSEDKIVGPHQSMISQDWSENRHPSDTELDNDEDDEEDDEDEDDGAEEDDKEESLSSEDESEHSEEPTSSSEAGEKDIHQ